MTYRVRVSDIAVVEYVEATEQESVYAMVSMVGAQSRIDFATAYGPQSVVTVQNAMFSMFDICPVVTITLENGHRADLAVRYIDTILFVQSGAEPIWAAIEMSGWTYELGTADALSVARLMALTIPQG
jgi:hypothetical protein